MIPRAERLPWIPIAEHLPPSADNGQITQQELEQLSCCVVWHRRLQGSVLKRESSNNRCTVFYADRILSPCGIVCNCCPFFMITRLTIDHGVANYLSSPPSQPRELLLFGGGCHRYDRYLRECPFVVCGWRKDVRWRNYSHVQIVLCKAIHLRLSSDIHTYVEGGDGISILELSNNKRRPAKCAHLRWILSQTARFARSHVHSEWIDTAKKGQL